jgi:hypothetical protein
VIGWQKERNAASFAKWPGRNDVAGIVNRYCLRSVRADRRDEDPLTAGTLDLLAKQFVSHAQLAGASWATCDNGHDYSPARVRGMAVNIRLS